MITTLLILKVALYALISVASIGVAFAWHLFERARYRRRINDIYERHGMGAIKPYDED